MKFTVPLTAPEIRGKAKQLRQPQHNWSRPSCAGVTGDEQSTDSSSDHLVGNKADGWKVESGVEGKREAVGM